jgi:hypothetical protein
MDRLRPAERPQIDRASGAKAVYSPAAGGFDANLLRLTRFLRRTGCHFAGKRYEDSKETWP